MTGRAQAAPCFRAALVFAWLLGGCGSDFVPYPASFVDAGVVDSSPIEETGTDTPEPSPVPIGAPCERDSECGDAECLTGRDVPGGYCTLGCGGECLRWGSCTDIAGSSTCGSRCDTDRDCRIGYSCDGRACVPAAVGGLDGTPCAEDDDCVGGTCFSGPHFPSGFCTVANCRQDSACRVEPDRTAVCASEFDVTFCAPECETDGDCRAGYSCVVGAVSRTSYCFVDDLYQPVPSGFAQVTSTLGECFEELPERWGFEAPVGTDSVVVTAYTTAGSGYVRIESIDGPNGRISFEVETHYTWLGSNSRSVHGAILPPYPNRASDFAPGRFDVTLGHIPSREPGCIDVELGESGGGALDLNIISATSFIPAALGPYHAGLRRAFDGVDEIFAPAGVRVGTVRFFDAAPEVVERYGIARDYDDLDRLSELTTVPAASRDGQISANVIVLGGIAIGSAAGLSPLLGPVGLHGTESSALFVDAGWITATGAGDTADFTAFLVAHEIGHFLGLFHTSEYSDGGHDPLDDTPRCANAPASSCADRQNLMFPQGGTEVVSITEDQAWVIAKNPLIRP